MKNPLRAAQALSDGDRSFFLFFRGLMQAGLRLGLPGAALVAMK
jgi:hypothetical protein